MVNLLQETIKVLSYYDKTLEDIEYVQLDDEYCLSGDFVKLAETINYDAGYGLAYINQNLLIIGNNWWLERREYDGSEWWEFQTFPRKPHIYNKTLKIEER